MPKYEIFGNKQFNNKTDEINDMWKDSLEAGKDCHPEASVSLTDATRLPQNCKDNQFEVSADEIGLDAYRIKEGSIVRCFVKENPDDRRCNKLSQLSLIKLL